MIDGKPRIARADVPNLKLDSSCFAFQARPLRLAWICPAGAAG
jgi:hypothetical protein